MPTVRSLHDSSDPPQGRLVLDYDARTKSRFLARLANGDEIAVQLPRGTTLAGGARLLADDGASYEVVAAAEGLSVATTSDPLLLTRAAYHLGNRHVPLEIGPGRLAYQHDHVLDDMVRRLGLTLTFERAPFSPEGGAYGLGAHHSHGHSDDHAHEHSHHEHAHEHSHHEHAHHDHDGPHEHRAHEAAPRGHGR